MKTTLPRCIRTLLGVWAHPDDEAYLSAGLMAHVRATGGRVAVVTATRGELGTPDPAEWPPERLAPLRERELMDSLAVDFALPQVSGRRARGAAHPALVLGRPRALSPAVEMTFR